MALRLRTIQYIPKGVDGWTSERRTFGQLLTLVYGPNGAGKTPLMKGILFALGYPVELPPDIVEHCDQVTLDLVDGDRAYQLRRRLSLDSPVVVVSDDVTVTLRGEQETTRWFLERISALPRALTNAQGKETQLYLSVIAPCFWVDQDLGWRSTYCPLKGKGWIRDQEQEMTRFLLGLQPRHPFRSREDLDDKLIQIDLLKQKIDSRKRLLGNVISRDLDAEILTLEERKRTVVARLRQVESGVALARAAVADDPVADLEQALKVTLGRLERLGNQQRRYAKVFKDLSAETEILSANATIAEEFRKFCGVPACGLFKDDEATFGRSLLFLKDQIKDLTSTTGALTDEINGLRERQAALEQEVEQSKVARRRRLESSGHGAFVSELETLSREMARLERELAIARQTQIDRQELEAFVSQHVEAEREAQELRAPARKQPKAEIDEARQQLQECLTTWVDVLRTQNVPRPITIDPDFNVMLGARRFWENSSESGSTRARLVLAFHAALFETALARRGNHPGWLILDAPKQHELNEDDLRAYVVRLRSLASRYPDRVQLVLATADRLLEPEPGEVVWEPTFRSTDGKDEPRFFGSPDQPRASQG